MYFSGTFHTGGREMIRPKLRCWTLNRCAQSTVMHSRSCGSFENQEEPSSVGRFLTGAFVRIAAFWRISTVAMSASCMLVGILVNALAQSSADHLSHKNSQQVSQQGSKVPSAEPNAVRRKSKGYLGVYLGDVSTERARE